MHLLLLGSAEEVAGGEVRIPLFGAAQQRLRPPIFLREVVFWDPQIQFFGPLRGIFEEKPGAPARGGRRAKPDRFWKHIFKDNRT